MLIESNDWKKIFWKRLSAFAIRLIYQQNGNVSWRRRSQIKQLAWPMAERWIGHWKSRLVFSERFPVVNWRSRSVAKSAYNSGTRCSEGCLDSVNGHTSTNPSTTTFISVWTYAGVWAIRVDTECKGIALETAVRTLIYVCKKTNG